MTNILIVEDDPMVQYIHQAYLKKINDSFQINQSTTLEKSQFILQNQKIDLILLDVHLEDGNGLELLNDIRKAKIDVEVILITASKDVHLVKESLHLGIVDYLIKPFTFERFKQSIYLYQKKVAQLQKTELNQSLIDSFLRVNTSRNDWLKDSIEKGLTVETLNHISQAINRLSHPFTIQELAKSTKLSHVSVRKYVAYLEKKELLTSENIYLKVGRPYKAYRWHVDHNKSIY